MLSQSELKEILHYNPNTGIFTWLKTVNGRATKGSIAGNSGNGYVRISYNKNRYWAHKLAFLYMEGHYPDSEVDHINRIKTDNSWNNLRIANVNENSQNKVLNVEKTSKFRGVRKVNSKWRSNIKCNGVEYHLGYFNTEIEAAIAYDKKALELHKEFAVLNFAAIA